MRENLHYIAHCIADKIDLASYYQKYPDFVVSKGTKVLYYQLDPNRYIYLVSYGVAVFSGMDHVEIAGYLDRLAPFTTHPKLAISSDDLTVSIGAADEDLSLGFDTLTLGRFDHPVNKMIMMHLAQSVALDHFNGLGQTILSEVKVHTQSLKDHGKVKLGQKKALKFIGKTLNAKNSIAENLYILDSPDVTWEDEYLDKLHAILARHFELVQRYREIDNTLKIVEDNLSIYMSYNHHQESSRLEWIIIILIVIEVLDTFITKML